MLEGTYAKLKDGSWGIRVKGTPIEGQQVKVTKKSGESKVELVARVVWMSDGVALCSIVASATRVPQAPATNRRAAQSYRRQDCRKYGWDGVVGSPSYYSSGQYDEDS